MIQQQIQRAIDLGVPEAAIEEWLDGGLIQNVMPWLSVDDREYILTGLSPEEWGKLFSEGEY